MIENEWTKDMEFDDLGTKQIECICPVCKKECEMSPFIPIHVLKCENGTCEGEHNTCFCNKCRAIFDVGKYKNVVSEYNLKRKRMGLKN